MTDQSTIDVLFVCMGNICRSPTAEGVFAKLVRDAGLVDRIRTDSAGTLDYHAGEPPDPRAQATAETYGIDISMLRARQVRAEDFVRFHYILAMDQDNLRHLKMATPRGHTGHVGLFCEFARRHDVLEVPDPYYGGGDGFRHVFELVHDASEGLLEWIVQEHFPAHAR